MGTPLIMPCVQQYTNVKSPNERLLSFANSFSTYSGCGQSFHSNSVGPSSDKSSLPSPDSIRKSPSGLIMPNLVTFLFSSQPKTRTKSTSLASLTEPKSPQLLIRKSHTSVALLDPSLPSVETSVVREPKKSFFRRLVSSKSATFTNKPAVSYLQKSTSSAYLKSKDWDESVLEPLREKSRCSRCTSCASVASRKGDTILCKLCLMDAPIEEMYQLQQCHCRFCKHCLVTYLRVLIREGANAIDCPDADCDCQGEIIADDIEMLAPEDVYQKYLKHKHEAEIAQDKNRTWCVTPDCDTVVELSQPLVTGRPSLARCRVCEVSFCAGCYSDWHGNTECSVKELVLNDTLKKCPRCSVCIERDSGCAQMQCKLCKHVFCWYCLTSLEDDFLLRHYDKGPCKNKLGHSRASVLWHRAQVVIIFASFGMLLIAASPLLLFVGPCLICRRCCHVCKLKNSSLRS